ncbi:hypothetical protein [Bogoriella caseilytica]|uniref:Uncharacterized protein n=1 Tax=Bogoriella caseilytica TaxID=56055 RepID=A0A3N2BAK6_9MICO|nr:hypothetical protein [Bogoriella caseilytica]ROR72285.1 hypothetical protein EDD31_0635 [Bogoriella caseilytica]
MSNNPFSTPDSTNPPPERSGQGNQPSYGAQPDYGQQPGHSAPGSKFGTQGYQPGSYGGPLERPKEFGLLLTMTLVIFALDLVSTVLGLIPVFTGELEDTMRTEMEAAGASAADIDTALSLIAVGAGVFALILLIVSIGLYLLVYFGLRAQKNWARITGIVLGILGVLFTLGSLVTGLGAAFATPVMIVSSVVTLLWVAGAIYWLILAFNSKVAGYLRQPKQA